MLGKRTCADLRVCRQVGLNTSDDPDSLPNPDDLTRDLNSLSSHRSQVVGRKTVGHESGDLGFRHSSATTLCGTLAKSHPPLSLFPYLQGGRKVTDSEDLSSPIHSTDPPLSPLLFGFRGPKISPHASCNPPQCHPTGAEHTGTTCTISTQRAARRTKGRCEEFQQIGVKDPKNRTSPWHAKFPS